VTKIAAPPPDTRLTAQGKGRLLGVEDVRLLLPRDRGKLVSAQWVRTNVARNKRIPYGRSVAWWEQDVIDWLIKMAGQFHKRRPRKRAGRKVA
jgi:hypothetical protein